MKLLSISTDRNLFKVNSDVRARQINYARERTETHLIVFTNRRSNFQPEKLANNLWIYPTNSSHKLFYIFDAIRLGGEIIQQRGITNLTAQDPFFSGLVAWWLKRCARNLYLELQVHADIGSPYFAETQLNHIGLKIAKFILPRADEIRVVSPRIKNFLVTNWQMPEDKITVRPIAVDLEKIKNAPVKIDLHQKYPQFAKIVLMASRLEPEKDYPLALTAWQKVRVELPQAGLVIVGSGSQKDFLRALVKKLKLKDDVIFEPWVAKSTLYSYYKSADLFLLTSRHEGYSLTLVEAQAAGCPIVSTDVGIVVETDATIVSHEASAIAQALITKLCASSS